MNAEVVMITVYIANVADIAEPDSEETDKISKRVFDLKLADRCMLILRMTSMLWMCNFHYA